MKVGDELLAINGESVVGLSHVEVNIAINTFSEFLHPENVYEFCGQGRKIQNFSLNHKKKPDTYFPSGAMKSLVSCRVG